MSDVLADAEAYQRLCAPMVEDAWVEDACRSSSALNTLQRYAETCSCSLNSMSITIVLASAGPAATVRSAERV